MDAARASLPKVPRANGPRDLEFVVAFPMATEKLLTTNSLGTAAETHWSARSDYRKAWRTAARDAFCAAREELAPLSGCPIEVTFAFPVPDRIHRDEHNLESTTKPAVDGIVDAGVLIPGDHTKPRE
jgi:hypothetical protein